MSDAPSIQPDEPFDGEDLTAAEYALGILNREERAAAEDRSARDPAFARSILDWVRRFAPLIEAVAPVEPSAALWPRIEAAVVGARSQPAASGAAALAPPVPANDAPAPRLALWRAWAIGATAVAAAAVLFIAVRPSHPLGGLHGPSVFTAPGHAGALVATLSLTETKASAFTVAYDPAQSTLYATPAADFSIPRARSAELWLIPADGKPRPMGVVDANKPASMPMPPQFKALAKEQATLALSIEPPGGSTTGAPTGPVIAAGKLAAV